MSAKQTQERIDKYKDRQFREARQRAIKSVQGMRVKQTRSKVR